MTDRLSGHRWSPDARERARQLENVYETVLSGGASPVAPRPVVSESWQRSLAALVDPTKTRPPHIFEHREVDRLRAAHPLASVLPLLRETLGGAADETGFMIILTDAQGHILWRDGRRDVLRAAEPVDLVEGTRWAEESVGTNAMGTAIAADKPVQIHSAEHLVRLYHPWTCAACPVHDADTGEVIGCVDVTGPLATFHPTTLALVVAAVKLAEAQLTRELAVRDARILDRNRAHIAGLRGEPGALLSATGRVLVASPRGWVGSRVPLPRSGDRIPLGDAGEGRLEPLSGGWLLRLNRAGGATTPQTPANEPDRLLTLRFLGQDRPHATINGKPVRLTLRHAEILTVLAMHPDGLTADELATALHGDTGKSVTVRAEMHRLRTVVGAEVVRTLPYRLLANIDADFLEARAALTAGRVRDAARLYRGPLLARSEAPAVREERELLAATLRAAVLVGGDADTLWSLAQTADGAVDTQLTERLLHVLPHRDPRTAVLSARLAAAE